MIVVTFSRVTLGCLMVALSMSACGGGDERNIRLSGVDEITGEVDGERDRNGCFEAAETTEVETEFGGNIPVSRLRPGTTTFCLANREGSVVTLLKLKPVDGATGDMQWTATHWTDIP